jgi:hypothetical protein
VWRRRIKGRQGLAMPGHNTKNTFYRLSRAAELRSSRFRPHGALRATFGCMSMSLREASVPRRRGLAIASVRKFLCKHWHVTMRWGAGMLASCIGIDL